MGDLLGWAYVPVSPTLGVQHLEKVPTRGHYAFILSDSILLPSTQEDALVGGAEDHAVCHHANQGGAVKTTGVATDSFAWNLDFSKLSPKPLTFPQSYLNLSMDEKTNGAGWLGLR